MTLTVKAPENPSPFVPSELATFLNGLADEADATYKASRLRQAANHFTELAQTPPAPPITYTQKDELLRLCRHPLLPKPEKTLTLVRYNTYDSPEADERIRHLQSLLSQLEDMRDAA